MQHSMYHHPGIVVAVVAGREGDNPVRTVEDCTSLDKGTANGYVHVLHKAGRAVEVQHIRLANRRRHIGRENLTTIFTVWCVDDKGRVCFKEILAFIL